MFYTIKLYNNKYFSKQQYPKKKIVQHYLTV